MATVRLKNNSGRRVTDGELVRLFPGTTDSFIVAKLSEFGIIGTVSGTILTGQVGTINLINTVEYDNIIDTPDLSLKQDLLVSGVNIKTINTESLLGSGNITITGGGGDSNIDGGSASSVYLPSQLIDGGNV